LYKPVLEAIATLDLLDPNGELAAEHDPQTPLPETIGAVGHQMAIARQKRYGNTALTFYQRCV